MSFHFHSFRARPSRALAAAALLLAPAVVGCALSTSGQATDEGSIGGSGGIVGAGGAGLGGARAGSPGAGQAGVGGVGGAGHGGAGGAGQAGVGGAGHAAAGGGGSGGVGASGGSAGATGGSGGCGGGQAMCATGCVDFLKDKMNCGSCGKTCLTGEVCSVGECKTSCGANLTPCSTGCVNVQSDPLNCGGCNMPCGADHVCAAGVCTIDCKGGPVSCNGKCIDEKSDPLNCGTCGHACASNEVCSAGMCATSCGGALMFCPKTKTCSPLTNDPLNCGGCGLACPGGANASTVCAASTCGLSCSMGFADCDKNPANGCEVSTLTDLANCGGCGNACALPNAAAACASGACTVGSCSAGFADCDNNPANGCEVSTSTDLANCGGCGTTCTLPNAVAACASGACAVGSCSAGFADCDNNPVNGCEASTTSDPNHCGGCGTVCALPNAMTTKCSAGVCGVATCNAGFGDCNGTAADGCEKQLSTDPMNCGKCGAVCPGAQASCVGGMCACPAGQTSCNGACVDEKKDPQHCGACGTSCGNGTSSCFGGACAKRVFVTKATLPGNLGGLAGADMICNTAGKTVQAGTTWKAWLSTGGNMSNSAGARMTHYNGPYAEVDGTLVAATWAIFASGTHLAPISLDETGMLAAGPAVWTGTDENGNNGGGLRSCQGWTSSDGGDHGTGGDASAMDSTWSNSNDFNCGASAHLYCVEQ